MLLQRASMLTCTALQRHVYWPQGGPVRVLDDGKQGGLAS